MVTKGDNANINMREYWVVGPNRSVWCFFAKNDINALFRARAKGFRRCKVYARIDGSPTGCFLGITSI